MANNGVLHRLLRKNASIWQTLGFAVANFIGLTIVITAIQFYRDISATLEGGNESMNGDFIVVTKLVGPFGGAMPFSASEIDSLRLQPWATDIAPFKASQFNVNAVVDFAGSRMSTALFFESVPDRFLDVNPAGWSFTPGDNTIPIVMSKDYLSLYNFGFASSRGLPAVSEAMIGLVPLKISVSGNGRQQTFDGRIVGFSSRLNTIAVPESFMDWANAEFGDGPSSEPSRLIVSTPDPGNPAISRYLENHGMETPRSAASSQLNHFLTVLTSVVISVGAVICVLALFILMLSLWLLLRKNQRKNRRLMLLGYTPLQVASVYNSLIVKTNVCVFIAASASMYVADRIWLHGFEALEVVSTSLVPALLAGAGLIVAITAVNIVTVYRTVKRCF